MYTVIAICSLMNFYYFRLDNIGNAVNSIFAIFFGMITVGLPIFYSSYYFKNFEKFLSWDN